MGDSSDPRPRFPMPGEVQSGPAAFPMPGPPSPATGSPYRKAAAVPAPPPPREVSRPASPQRAQADATPVQVLVVEREEGTWIVRYPRIGGGLLLVAGVTFGAEAYDFFFNGGLLRVSALSTIIRDVSPLMTLLGLWILVFGVPRTRPRPAWWRVGLAAIVGTGVLGSLALATALHLAPTKVVDPRTHRRPEKVLSPAPAEAR